MSWNLQQELHRRLHMEKVNVQECKAGIALPSHRKRIAEIVLPSHWKRECPGIYNRNRTAAFI